MLYRFLKIIIGLGIRLYYRRIKIQGVKNLREKKPTIIIANHPNTLMDAWLIGHICKDPIYYMTKGVFFDTPLKKKLLMSLGMIPINRAVDSVTRGVSNQDSFELCYKVLEQGKTLVIFPEGNSMSDRLLRNLKSGTARIALETEKRNNGELGIKIIPFGLIYLQPEKFRSSVLVNIGEEIDPLPFLDEFRHDSLKAARGLTEQMRHSMEELLVDATDKEEETLADNITAILSSEYLKEKKGLDKDIALLKRVNQSVNRIKRIDEQKYQEVEKLVRQIEWQIDRLAIRSDFLDRNFRFGLFFRQIIQSGIGLILTFPLFLYGFVHSYIPYKITDVFLPRIVTDKEWYAPLAVLLGLILYPLTYGSFIYLSGYVLDLNWIGKLLYLLTMPITGLFAWYFYQYFRHVTVKWRFIQLMRNKKEKEILKELRSTRAELRSIILED